MNQDRMDEYHQYAATARTIGINVEFLTPEDWSATLLASIAEIEARTPNFHSYTATGAEHCIINQSTFYTREVNGVRFSDWLTNLLATGDPGTVVP